MTSQTTELMVAQRAPESASDGSRVVCVITADEMHRFNEAREHFHALRALLWPVMSRLWAESGTGADRGMEVHLEAILICTRNFLVKHRDTAAPPCAPQNALPQNRGAEDRQ